MSIRSRRFGPGLLIAAAFIGPGTVTTASVAGARFGFALLWAVLFSVLATVVLQEMSARVGLVSRTGLGECLRSTFRPPALRAVCIVLVISAIGLGNHNFPPARMEFFDTLQLAMSVAFAKGWVVRTLPVEEGGIAHIGGTARQSYRPTVVASD